MSETVMDTIDPRLLAEVRKVALAMRNEFSPISVRAVKARVKGDYNAIAQAVKLVKAEISPQEATPNTLDSGLLKAFQYIQKAAEIEGQDQLLAVEESASEHLRLVNQELEEAHGHIERLTQNLKQVEGDMTTLQDKLDNKQSELNQEAKIGGTLQGQLDQVLQSLEDRKQEIGDLKSARLQEEKQAEHLRLAFQSQIQDVANARDHFQNQYEQSRQQQESQRIIQQEAINSAQQEVHKSQQDVLEIKREARQEIEQALQECDITNERFAKFKTQSEQLLVEQQNTHMTNSQLLEHRYKEDLEKVTLELKLHHKQNEEQKSAALQHHQILQTSMKSLTRVIDDLREESKNKDLLIKRAQQLNDKKL